MVPDDDITIAPPGCILKPGQVVGPATLGQPDIGMLVFFIIRTSDNKGFIKCYKGAAKGFDWDSPLDIAKLNQWRREVVRVEVEDHVTRGYFHELSAQQYHPVGTVRRDHDDTSAAYLSPYPQARFRNEYNGKWEVNVVIGPNDRKPPRAIPANPDSRSLFVLAKPKAGGDAELYVYRHWVRVEFNKTGCSKVRRWRTQVCNRCFKDDYGADEYWVDQFGVRAY